MLEVSAIFTFDARPEVDAFVCCKTFHFVAMLLTLLPVSILKTPVVGLNKTGAFAVNAALARASVKYKLVSSPILFVFKLTTPIFPFTLCTGAPGVNSSTQSDKDVEKSVFKI